jgi:hypothetical protein
LGGNRLWLRDRGGDEFFYAHLSAFAPLVANGAHVQAGEVIGFMGETGETDGLSTHLEFEIRPVSLVYLGSEGVVDPTSYFASWRPETSVQLPAGPGWAPTVPGSLPAPVPAATLVASSDIAAAEALDPGALRRILAHDARR